MLDERAAIMPFRAHHAKLKASVHRLLLAGDGRGLLGLLVPDSLLVHGCVALGVATLGSAHIHDVGASSGNRGIAGRRHLVLAGHRVVRVDDSVHLLAGGSLVLLGGVHGGLVNGVLLHRLELLVHGLGGEDLFGEGKAVSTQ